MVRAEISREDALKEITLLRKRISELENNVASLQLEPRELNRAENGQNYQAVFECANDVIILLNTRGEVTDVNGKLKEILGYDRENLVNKKYTLLTKIITEESLAILAKNFKRRMAGQVIQPYEITMVNKDGIPVIVEINARALIRDQHVVGDIAILRDVTERKRAEEELRYSEKNLKTYLENAPDGVCIYDLTGIFLYGNHAAEEILGYKKEELLGQSILDLSFLNSNDISRATKLIALNSSGMSTGPDEFELKRKEGGLRWVEMTTTPIKQQETTLVLNFIRDITHRKKAEDEIRESRARFKDLAKLLPLAVWETDENGILTYTNDETMRLYGYSIKDTALIHYLQNLILEDRARATSNVERIMKGELIGGIDYTCVRKDGNIFPVLTYASAIVKDGKSVGLRGITIDITKQKIAEKQLEQAAQDWRVTFDSLTDMVCILDSNFRISRVNRAYANMLKKEPKELLGKVCYELINRDCPCLDCPHKKTLQTGKPARAEFYEPILATFIEVSTSPIFDEKGGVKGTVHIMRDISERKQMEQQLMLTDRLASVGELASGVAHELNNPLTSVIGFSQLLMEGEIPTAIKEDLGLINSEAQRAASIVKNLLTFARKHAAVKQPTKINNLIEDVLKLRAYEQKVNNIEIIKNLASDIPEIMLDYFQVQQVFLNIIINAEFFMTEAHHRGLLTITTEKIGRIVRVTFADDGPGIAQENLNRIFDPFFTTKEVGKGTGLGLSICHGIITEHNGTIHAESGVGKGATFIIELPLSELND